MANAGKFRRGGVMLALALAVSSCGGSNYFAPASNKDSDDAIMEDVKKLVDDQDWSAALARMDDLSSTARNSYEGVRTEAGIYAGRCGLDFFRYSSGLKGSGTLFSLFMSGFTSASVNVADCQSAQSLIESKLGATAVDRAASLTNQQAQNVNFFMAILGSAKIGAQLRAVADTNQDGTVDGGFDACRAAAKMTSDQIIQVGTGFALLLTNLSTVIASFGSSNQSNLTDLSNACTGITPNPCAITDPSNSTWAGTPTLPLVELPSVTAFRSLIQSQAYGVGSCASGSGGYPFDCCVP